MADRLSDGLLLVRGDAACRARLGPLDDRDDVYVLREVGTPNDEPVACAVVRRTDDHATLSCLSGPPELLDRLVRALCDALREDGLTSLSAGTGVTEAAARQAGVATHISL